MRAHEMEDRARVSERLAFVGKLAGGLAHEIKNPLGTLNLNLQLMKEDLEKSSTPVETRICKKIDVLQREAKRLEEILNDFLRYARGPQPNLAEHDLNRVVDDVVNFVSPEMTLHKVQVRTQYDETIPPMKLDADLLKQALLNIVINAQQAMPNGGELILQSTRKGATARIDITDTGEGIPPEQREKIFNVYYSTKKTGTGLGLPTAKRIIEEHRGTIDFQSEVGKGTCFTIEIPIESKSEKEE
ncbi:MAG: two-component sensor histidine kinase [Planctomycetes bacterium]|nr:two-component sensor histidine kinase [Planctomycetota bacterium]